MPTKQETPEETKQSEIKESYRVVYSERVVRTFEVRAEDRDEIDECYPDELEVLSEDSEYVDSDREEIERFLSDSEDRERLDHHKAWKGSEQQHGERYSLKECDVENWQSITAEHDGALFDKCAFRHTKFEGLNFDTVEMIDCSFKSCRVLDCEGVEEREIDKPGSLWFSRSWQYARTSQKGKYVWIPVIIKKWVHYHTKHQEKPIGEYVSYIIENNSREVWDTPQFYKEPKRAAKKS